MPLASPRLLMRYALASLLAAFAITTQAGVLPEDRADLLYHVYDGGGAEVKGPSLFVRKKFGESISANATYDIDMVSSASIDVLTSASPYTEERTQWSTGLAYLRGKTTYNINFLNSAEPDYISDNISFGISEDMFGDLTTVTLGFTRGKDDVKKRISKGIYEPAAGVGNAAGSNAERRSYRLGISQILTKNLLVGLNYESIALEGYLQNPYRSVRYGPSNATPSTQAEKFPRTRASNAVALDARYYLPYRASTKIGYRYYTDSWGVVAHNADFDYIHPIGSNWTIEGSARYYTQTSADFYSDLFPFIDAQNFLARDKLLSTFNDWSVRLGGSWRMRYSPRFSHVVSVYADHIQYNFLDFKNTLVKASPSAQPLYNYSANVFMLQYSLRYQ
ncbi:MAG: DUF3570 domain-containing protein [Steroidobacteraceae bacterium]